MSLGDILLGISGGLAWLGSAWLLARWWRAVDPPEAPDPRHAPDLLTAGLLALVGGQLVRYALPQVIQDRLALFFALQGALLIVTLGLWVWCHVIAPGRDVLGLRATGLVRGAAVGVLAYVFILPLILGIGELNTRYVIDDPEATQTSLEMFRSVAGDDRGVVVGAMMLVLVILVPVFEETLYRGVIFTGLRQSLSPVAGERGGSLLAIVLSSLLFTIVHASFTWMPIFFLALGLGLVYERTRNLWAPVALHASHNLIILCLALAG